MEDSLYFIRLEETVIRLEKVESQNDILTAALILLAVLVIAATVIIVLHLRRSSRRDRLTGSLLLSHAEALPEFTEKVSTISGKSIRLSFELYEEFQYPVYPAVTVRERLQKETLLRQLPTHFATPA